jgi:dUTP pyrophosphatase
MHTTILTDRDIRARLHSAPPLVEGLRDEATQIQPCGVDLTVRTVSRFATAGTIDFDNSGRVLPERATIPWDDSFAALAQGAYHVVYNEVVNLPRDVMALAYPRSSLLRCGVTLHTAVWDPGYSGRAESLLVVHNPCGFRLGEGARVAQLVFTALGSDVESVYNGRFRGENLGSQWAT